MKVAQSGAACPVNQAASKDVYSKATPTLAVFTNPSSEVTLPSLKQWAQGEVSPCHGGPLPIATHTSQEDLGKEIDLGDLHESLRKKTTQSLHLQLWRGGGRYWRAPLVRLQCGGVLLLLPLPLPPLFSLLLLSSLLFYCFCKLKNGKGREEKCWWVLCSVGADGSKGRGMDIATMLHVTGVHMLSHTVQWSMPDRRSVVQMQIVQV